MRDKIVEDLKDLALNPYDEHKQRYEVNGHILDLTYSEKLMNGLLIDNGCFQIKPNVLGEKVVTDMEGENLTETQFVLKKMGLEYADVAQ